MKTCDIKWRVDVLPTTSTALHKNLIHNHTDQTTNARACKACKAGDAPGIRASCAFLDGSSSMLDPVSSRRTRYVISPRYASGFVLVAVGSTTARGDLHKAQEQQNEATKRGGVMPAWRHRLHRPASNVHTHEHGLRWITHLSLTVMAGMLSCVRTMAATSSSSPGDSISGSRSRRAMRVRPSKISPPFLSCAPREQNAHTKSRTRRGPTLTHKGTTICNTSSTRYVRGREKDQHTRVTGHVRYPTRSGPGGV